MADTRSLAAAWAAKVTNQPTHLLYSRKAYEKRGHIAKLPDLANEEELVFVGPAGTGKTLGILDRLNEIAWTYPHARILIVRKVRADLADSTLVTFERDILGESNPICTNVQRKYRQIYRYPNGSEIVLGGMDRPTRVLSSEWDIIYVAEATELSVVEWEMLVMRLRSGVVPNPQLIADCNPDSPYHWLKQRADAGLVKMFNTYHKDNPRYWDAEAEAWTPEGARYVGGILQRLTGVRRERFLEGRWVIAEGMIYVDWNEDHHLVDAFEVPRSWRRFRVVDFGYTNAFVCQWWAIDPDGRLYMYREIYMTRRLVSDHAEQIKALTGPLEKIETTVCDHDAEGRAQLEAAGIQTRAARKAVSTGIEKVSLRLRVEDDGKPRVMVFRDALVERDVELEEAKLPTCTKDEIPGYVWADNKKKEEPVKEHDHGCDAMRYAVMYVDDGGNVSATARAVGVRGGRRSSARRGSRGRGRR